MVQYSRMRSIEEWRAKKWPTEQTGSSFKGCSQRPKRRISCSPEKESVAVFGCSRTCASLPFWTWPSHTNHHVETSFSPDEFERYLCVSSGAESNEITCLPVDQLQFLVAKFNQGSGGSIDNCGALEFFSPGHPEHYVALSSLGLHPSHRYDKLGVMTDLEKAILLGRDTLRLVLRTARHQAQSMALNNLSLYLSTRYKHLGTMENLNAFERNALAFCLLGHPLRSNDLAVDLSTWYNQLGEMEVLSEPIFLSRDALVLRPLGHPDRSGSLNNLAIYLSTRYNQLGAMEDLNEVIVLDRDALALRPPGLGLTSLG